MIINLTSENLDTIRNPAFAAYAETYKSIYDNFMAQISATGITVATDDQRAETDAALARLHALEATFRNCGRSIVANAISPACVACQTGEGSATFFVSLRCHRDCYYCFNPNQVDYDFYQHHQRNPAGELAEGAAAGQRAAYLALTGGEPLVHPQETVDFFETAQELFPTAHTRLYTTGDQADEELLTQLQEAGLQEIRFSIRTHDTARAQRHTLSRIALARQFIPTVMVEMPVLPDSTEAMQELLLELDELSIHSINLLELCYPLNNAKAFNERDFQVKKWPYQTMYNYWYAGGLPVAGSELACLDLLAFAMERRLSIGVHYCSLENKLTGQNYQQNEGQPLPGTHYFSDQDYLLKSAKVFGGDIAPVFASFKKLGYEGSSWSKKPRYLEFHVDQIPRLAEQGLDIEIGISTSTLEEREDGTVLRELKVDLTTPSQFDLSADV